MRTERPYVVIALTPRQKRILREFWDENHASSNPNNPYWKFIGEPDVDAGKIRFHLIDLPTVRLMGVGVWLGNLLMGRKPHAKKFRHPDYPKTFSLTDAPVRK